MYLTVDNLVVAKQWFFISSALFWWLRSRKEKFSAIFPTFCLRIWGTFCMDTLYKYHSKGMPLWWTLLMSIIFIEFGSKVHVLLWALSSSMKRCRKNQILMVTYVFNAQDKTYRHWTSCNYFDTYGRTRNVHEFRRSDKKHVYERNI